MGKRFLLYEDNQAVVRGQRAYSYAFNLPLTRQMVELRKLWYILDANDINIRPRYIRSAANIWADGLSRQESST